MTDYATHIRDWFQDVYDFHRKFGCVINNQPVIPPDSIRRLRSDMEHEELAELDMAAMSGDLEGVADAIADLIYVLLGRAVSYGIDIRPVWAAVHRANMAKDGGPTRADGKILKPDGWVAPDIGGIIEQQRSNGWQRRERGPCAYGCEQMDTSWLCNVVIDGVETNVVRKLAAARELVRRLEAQLWQEVRDGQ